jgi:hypothetical protein
MSTSLACKVLKQFGFTSYVGHQDMANLLTSLIGAPVEFNRVSTKFDNLKDTDKIIVAQYMGGRLPEGSTTLPEGAKIEFFQINF